MKDSGLQYQCKELSTEQYIELLTKFPLKPYKTQVTFRGEWYEAKKLIWFGKKNSPNKPKPLEMTKDTYFIVCYFTWCWPVCDIAKIISLQRCKQFILHPRFRREIQLLKTDYDQLQKQLLIAATSKSRFNTS